MWISACKHGGGTCNFLRPASTWTLQWERKERQSAGKHVSCTGWSKHTSSVCGHGTAQCIHACVHLVTGDRHCAVKCRGLPTLGFGQSLLLTADESVTAAAGCSSKGALLLVQQAVLPYCLHHHQQQFQQSRAAAAPCHQTANCLIGERTAAPGAAQVTSWPRC
jgi:hypothetical protein